MYLPWLTSQCLKAGVVLKRGIFKHISEAAHAHHSGQKANLIANCTGLSAGKLGGVEDKSMVPARGQTVLVRNEAIGIVGGSGTDDGDDELDFPNPLFPCSSRSGVSVLPCSFRKDNADLEKYNRVCYVIPRAAGKLKFYRYEHQKNNTL